MSLLLISSLTCILFLTFPEYGKELEEPPSALLCSNDMAAIGVLREAYEQEITIPDDLSVVGFDDIHLAEFTPRH